jgi:hypothetical protein
MSTDVGEVIPRPVGDGFAALNEAHRRFAPLPSDLAYYGRSILGETILLETPASVLGEDCVLTNPTQSEYGLMKTNGEVTKLSFAYVRKERAFNHLGTSEAVPYGISWNGQGQPSLFECTEALVVPGEDPRLTRDVRLAGHLGVHAGWLLSTVQAQAASDNPEVCLGLRQTFYWGEKLGRLEQIGEGPPNVKNTTIGTLYVHDSDTSVGAVGRPFPHLSYHQAPNLIEALDPERILHGDIITKEFLPDLAYRIHIGPNTLIRRGRDRFEVNAHEAFVSGSGKKTLNYRLANYGFEIPNRDMPKGQFVVLGVVASRSQFPDAEPKLPEGEVGDFRNILYGSTGNNGPILTGISDRHIGYSTRLWLQRPTRV